MENEKTLDSELTQVLFENTSIVAETLVSFALWVVKSALDMNIKTLYFLARDGYLMHMIAQKICDKFKLELDCKYLFCSRFSLRVPSYHLIGDEAYSLICEGGHYVTPRVLLLRSGLSKCQCDTVLENMGYDKVCDKKISKHDRIEFKHKLMQCKCFNEYLYANSKSAYENTVGYLMQEGILDKANIALVDSGWTGSVQRTFRQLVESVGFSQKITGFYFGLYNQSMDSRDGEYHSWYFSKRRSMLAKAKFNNNLFESICVAPHEMTCSYVYKNGVFKPKFARTSSAEFDEKRAMTQIKTVKRVCSGIIEKMDFCQYNNSDNLRCAKLSLSKLMYMPTRTQAQVYLNCSFCDDVSHCHTDMLVRNDSNIVWSDYLLHKRIIHRFFYEENNYCDLFWAYGSLAASNMKFKCVYRINILFWELIRNVYRLVA